MQKLFIKNFSSVKKILLLQDFSHSRILFGISTLLFLQKKFFCSRATPVKIQKMGGKISLSITKLLYIFC